MLCRYCDEILNDQSIIDFGKTPMTPNAIEKNTLTINDHFYEYHFKIVICNKCGLIQQYTSPDPNILYFRFKNEIVGEKWKRHFQQFMNLILNNAKKGSALLEVGAGDLSLANMLMENGIDDLTVVEKNVDTNNMDSRIKFYFSYIEEVNFPKKFDIVYSSHVFEHVSNIQQHIKKISQVLNPNGKFIFSLPNFKKWITNFNLNAFSQEHIIYPLVENIETILSKYNLKINKIYEFEDHSMFIESEINDCPYVMKNNRNSSVNLLCDFKNNLEKFEQFVNKHTSNNEKIYIFGANSSSQLLLGRLLKNKNIICILDNAKIKENKYLYGFNYIVKKPNVIQNESEATVLIFTGTYVDEIKKQIMDLNNKIKIITMNDFKNSIN